jgi:hypothetical protein
MAERLAASSLDGDGTVPVEVEVATGIGGHRAAEGDRGCGDRGGSTAGTMADVGPGRPPTTGAPR